MWLSDENFDRWRSENKNEVEPKIIVYNIMLLKEMGIH